MSDQHLRPLLKWLGGKTQLLPKLIPQFPSVMKNYHEIFVGGGSVLLALLQQQKNGDILVNGLVYAYDANDVLISMYKNVQSSPNELNHMTQLLITKMNECQVPGTVIRKPTCLVEALSSEESYYYWIRQQYNLLSKEEKRTLTGSSMFIFLNKTCFRGIFRVNGSGGYNVPYGHYKKPEIVNRCHLLEVSDMIRDVVFECCDYTDSLSRVGSDDFVYMDPPYAPENQLSFVNYTENGFDLNKHIELFAMSRELKEKNVRMLMSNADVELVRTNFPIESFGIERLLCKRSINSKNPAAKTVEVFIRNYEY